MMTNEEKKVAGAYAKARAQAVQLLNAAMVFAVDGAELDAIRDAGQAVSWLAKANSHKQQLLLTVGSQPKEKK